MTLRVLVLLLLTKVAKICLHTSPQSSRAASSRCRKTSASLSRSPLARKASKLRTFVQNNRIAFKTPACRGFFSSAQAAADALGASPRRAKEDADLCAPDAFNKRHDTLVYCKIAIFAAFR